MNPTPNPKSRIPNLKLLPLAFGLLLLAPAARAAACPSGFGYGVAFGMLCWLSAQVN